MLLQDNTNFLHIKQWSDSSGRTQLRSVGLLVASPGFAAGPAPTVNNCLLLTTNTTLLQALRPHAAVATPLPLLVYLTSNVTIGLHPPLPTYGVLVKRPVIFVGLQSLVTSIDFEMVVNQLNLTGSPYSNSTFVATALENLAPGDTITSAVAAPFSIAVSNNLWSVFYNRYRWQSGARCSFCYLTKIKAAVTALHACVISRHAIFLVKWELSSRCPCWDSRCHTCGCVTVAVHK